MTIASWEVKAFLYPVKAFLNQVKGVANQVNDFSHDHKGEQAQMGQKGQVVRLALHYGPTLSDSRQRHVDFEHQQQAHSSHLPQLHVSAMNKEGAVHHQANHQVQLQVHLLMPPRGPLRFAPGGTRIEGSSIHSANNLPCVKFDRPRNLGLDISCERIRTRNGHSVEERPCEGFGS